MDPIEKIPSKHTGAGHGLSSENQRQEDVNAEKGTPRVPNDGFVSPGTPAPDPVVSTVPYTVNRSGVTETHERTVAAPQQPPNKLNSKQPRFDFQPFAANLYSNKVVGGVISHEQASQASAQAGAAGTTEVNKFPQPTLKPLQFGVGSRPITATKSSGYGRGLNSRRDHFSSEMTQAMNHRFTIGKDANIANTSTGGRAMNGDKIWKRGELERNPVPVLPDALTKIATGTSGNRHFATGTSNTRKTVSGLSTKSKVTPKRAVKRDGRKKEKPNDGKTDDIRTPEELREKMLKRKGGLQGGHMAQLYDTVSSVSERFINEGDQNLRAERADFVQEYTQLMSAHERQFEAFYDNVHAMCTKLKLNTIVPYLEDDVSARVDDETAEDVEGKLGVKKVFLKSMQALQTDMNIVKRRGNLPQQSAEFLKNWVKSHDFHPYPTDAEKREMSKSLGITVSQISHWFINYRKRVWKPNLPEDHPARCNEPAKKPKLMAKKMDSNTNT